MRPDYRRPRADQRRGTAAVELAVFLPFLLFMVVVAVDFARVYRNVQIITTCARNGAIYGSDSPAKAIDTAGISAAALADAGDLPTPPTVTSTTGTDAAGNMYLRVTVAGPFQTITKYPGVPSSLTITRTVQMRVAPTQPAGLGYSTN
jgi:Flp pilus assembly protein TadG